MKTIGVVLFLLVAFSKSVFSAISEVTIENANPSVEFLAIGKPSALKIKGELAKSSGSILGKIKLNSEKNTFQFSGNAKVKLDSFDTGIGLRNEHMKKKYLETEKFPEAVLEILPVNLKEDFSKNSVEEKEIPFKGQLTLHGQTKPIEGVVDLKKEGNTLDSNFNFQFAISDFGIGVPAWLGITVSKDVKIAVALKGALGK